MLLAHPESPSIPFFSLRGKLVSPPYAEVCPLSGCDHVWLLNTGITTVVFGSPNEKIQSLGIALLLALSSVPSTSMTPQRSLHQSFPQANLSTSLYTQQSPRDL